MHHDERGHEMTTSSSEAAVALNTSIHNFLHWKSDVMPHVSTALKADPEFGFGHVVSGLLLNGARNSNYRGKIDASLQAAQSITGNMTPRELLYLKALEAGLEGRVGEAATCYETILAHNPRDLLAQRLCQNDLFWIGEMKWSSEISGRIAEHWNSDVPGYGIHLSCRSFDLEETNQFEQAEKLGRKAVDIDPTDPWGTHAVAHVLIMQGRHNEGIAWLDGLKDNWADVNQMSLHLWWHRSLFHLELGEFDAVLEIYDAWVRNRELPLTVAVPDLYIDMQNGASMLLRLELRAIDVADRWNELADLTLARLNDHTNPFTSAHFAIILAAAGKFDEADELMASMLEFAKTDQGTFGPRYTTAAIPAARAAIAQRKGEYQTVVDLLMPARRMLWQMGGSQAQRDLFFLILADALTRLGHTDLLDIVLNDIEHAGFSDAASRIGYRQAN